MPKGTPNTRTTCSIEGCENGGRITREMCSSHYHRFMRHGDPLAGNTPIGAPLAWLRRMIEEVSASDDDSCRLDWPYCRSGFGYPQVTWKGQHRVAHQVVLELTGRPMPTPGQEGRHLCGKGHLGCLHPRHLAWGTHVENEADKRGHGTWMRVRGDRHPNSTLTEADVRAIRASTESNREAGRRFGVSRVAISRIRNRHSWAWLE